MLMRCIRSNLLATVRSVGCQCHRNHLDTTKYVQGFSPKKGVREYFYYIDHQGQLFLADTKIRNFVTCFKGVSQIDYHGAYGNPFDCTLDMLPIQLINTDGKYSDDFPYVSPCGREVNYVQCENKPIVFTDVLQNDSGTHLVVNGIGSRMTVPLKPEKLCMLPRNGRVYHPAFEKCGGVGILKTSLAIEFSQYFSYEVGDQEADAPTHFTWNGTEYKLDNQLWELMKNENVFEFDDD